MITSVQNKKVKEWMKLKEKKYRDETGYFLIEGDHLLKEALKYHALVEVITTEEKEYEVTTYHVTKEVLKKISSLESIPSVIGICKKREEKELLGPTFILDGIQDPGNLGTIIRSAVAFSIPNIVLSDTSVDFYNPKVIRSTEGMLFSVNIVRKNLKEYLPIISKHYQLIGTDVKKGKQIEDIKLEKNYAIIIGSEGMGMSNFTKEQVEDFIYLPMNNTCESLNAAVSASIIMYELQKRKL